MPKFQRQLSKHSKGEQGFTLVTVLGLGLMMMLMGAGLMMRAQQDAAIAMARKDTGKGQAIADGGANRVLAMLSNPPNAVLLGLNYDPINPKTGQNYLGADGTPNSGDETTTAIDQWSSSSPSFLNGSIGSGTYSLLAYRYNASSKQGMMVVQGQQDANTTTVLVGLSIYQAAQSLTGPGLWIASNPNSKATGGSTSLQTNIQDSTLAANTNSTNVASLTSRQSPIPPTNAAAIYNATPGVAFPVLPTTATTPPVTGNPGVYTLVQIDNSTVNLPRVGDVPNNGVLTYSVTNTGNSINLTGGGVLNVGTGSGTVILYLQGGMNLSGGSSIQLASGSKLIIFANSNLTLSGSSTAAAVNNSGNITDSQIYLVGANTVTLSGASPMRGFLFAPAGNVTSSGGSSFNGVMWANSWQGSGSSVVQENPIDLSETLIANTAKLQIHEINNWRKLQNF